MAEQENDKVKVEINRDLANELKKLMQVGDTYSTVIQKLLDDKKVSKYGKTNRTNG